MDRILTNDDAVRAGYPNLATYRMHARGEARRAAQAEEAARVRRVAEERSAASGVKTVTELEPGT